MPEKTIQTGLWSANDIRALREQIHADRQAGRGVDAARGLRRLRRRVELKPNEHRQLFRNLRQSGKSPLVDRYIRVIEGAKPDTVNWSRVCLALWSEGQTDRLFWWASQHPEGPGPGRDVLLDLARVSQKFGETRMADAIVAWTASGSVAPKGPAASAVPPRDPAGAPAVRESGRGLERLARQWAEEGRLSDALALVGKATSPGSGERIRVSVLRGLYASGQYAAQLEATLDFLDRYWPYEDLDQGIATQIVAAGRLLLRRGILAHAHAYPPDTWLSAHPGPPTPLAGWVRAMILTSMMRREKALNELRRVRETQVVCPNSGLDFNAEIGAVHLLYNDLGQARPHFDQSSEAGRRDHAAAVERLTVVTGLCGPADYFPECLVDVIFEELGRDGPIGYVPEPGHLATVTGTLAQGGGERQTANVIAAMAREPAIRAQTVLVRSIDGDHAFFLPIVKAAGADVVVYGEAFRERSELDRLTPELAARPRLRAAVDLLPLRHREEVLRLVRQYLDRRPAVVHVRQDLTESALACAIAGVPRFLIHRGSLARNTWSLTPLQTETINRPMRHLYRRLLADTGFFLVNNSRAGIVSDQTWLDRSGEDKFHVVHNAFDFEGLGPTSGPNLALKASLGIAAGAPVVGGVFRMAAVKRPLLWLETAHRILQTLPDTHFILVGDDGDLGQAVREEARRLGMADRLHMPGAVRDVGDWYRVFDVLLLTSDREGLPNVTIEAQHFGIPVVTTDVGGAGETLLDGATGFLVAGDEPVEGLSLAVLRALTDVEWRQRAVETAPTFVHEKFDGNRARAGLLDLFGLA